MSALNERLSVSETCPVSFQSDPFSSVIFTPMTSRLLQTSHVEQRRIPPGSYVPLTKMFVVFFAGREYKHTADYTPEGCTGRRVSGLTRDFQEKLCSSRCSFRIIWHYKRLDRFNQGYAVIAFYDTPAVCSERDVSRLTLCYLF